MQYLEVPLALLELKEALNLMHREKSVGLNGLPPELFLELWDVIGLLLLDCLNYSLDQGWANYGLRATSDPLVFLIRPAKD